MKRGTRRWRLTALFFIAALAPLWAESPLDPRMSLDSIDLLGSTPIPSPSDPARTAQQAAVAAAAVSRTAYVTVVDQDENPVLGLHAGDVEVREDGKPCAARRFEATTRAPEITLIVDLFDRNDTERLKAALGDFVLETPPGSRVVTRRRSHRRGALQLGP